MLDRYTYESTLAASEVIHWRVEDIIGGEKRLDFGKPFMPELLAQTEPLSFLTREEKGSEPNPRQCILVHLRPR